jgi:hypothetical protein
MDQSFPLSKIKKQTASRKMQAWSGLSPPVSNVKFY